MTVEELGVRARAAFAFWRSASRKVKDEALSRIILQLQEDREVILKANEKDLEEAVKAGMKENMQDRLRLTEKRLEDIEKAVEKLIELDDPIGEIIEGKVRPNGLQIRKVRVPMGCVGMIYEARPNVTVDAATLCLKTGNSVLLRGGKEAIHTNIALTASIRKALEKMGADEDGVILIEDTSRASAQEMMGLTGILDVLIPRGGAGLIQSVKREAKVPVIETGVGNCHIYVDASADVEMAIAITVNAKTSRPSVCNAAESLLVHQEIASEFLPRLREKMPEVELCGCEETLKILPDIRKASEDDYAREYLDLKMSVKIVESTEEAILHIAKYSTGHSEAIVTKDLVNAMKFTQEVDSAAVYVNASTRFTDGGEFGEGAEIGISTQKLHARGPMGLRALTTSKFIIMGDGQIR